MAQQDIQHIIIDMRRNGRRQELATKPKHLSHWCEINVAVWSPWRIVPKKSGIDYVVDDCLCRQCPIRHIQESHQDPDDT